MREKRLDSPGEDLTSNNFEGLADEIEKCQTGLGPRECSRSLPSDVFQPVIR
jgi:hypothetical protein